MQIEWQEYLSKVEEIERLKQQVEEACKARDLARTVSNRDLEAKRIAEEESFKSRQIADHINRKPLEMRVWEWVYSRIGARGCERKERAMRLFEEAVELCQAEGLPKEDVLRQVEHVFARPVGDPIQEGSGVAVGILGWCASVGVRFYDIAIAEILRIEAKPMEEIRGSLARKHDAGLVTYAREQGNGVPSLRSSE